MRELGAESVASGTRYTMTVNNAATIPGRLEQAKKLMPDVNPEHVRIVFVETGQTDFAAGLIGPVDGDPTTEANVVLFNEG